MSDDAPAAPQVRDNAADQRFEVTRDDEVLGFAAYRRAGTLVVFTHTQIDPAHEGEGLGGLLVRAALDDVRAHERSALPICPFVKGWIERHPDYQDLVYRQPPSRVDD